MQPPTAPSASLAPPAGAWCAVGTSLVDALRASAIFVQRRHREGRRGAEQPIIVSNHVSLGSVALRAVSMYAIGPPEHVC